MKTLLRLQVGLDAYLETHAVEAEWRQRLGSDFELLAAHLKPTGKLALSYPCPSPGGDNCPRVVLAHNGDFVAVCANVPAECAPLRLTKAQLKVLALDREAALAPVIARVCEQECLARTTAPALDGLLPVGMLVRRVGRTLVVLATDEGSRQRAAVLELRRVAGADAVAVLVPDSREPCIVGMGHAELGLEASRPRLHRALKLLWPESWAARAKTKEAVFEEVEMEFASEKGNHAVLLNGEPLAMLRQSNIRFARLLLLAAARAAHLDVEHGGWLNKSRCLELDEAEVDLVDIRKALVAGQPDGYAGLAIAERKALVQSSPDRPGMLRLALHPRQIHFHPSLAHLQLHREDPDEAENKPAKRRANKSRKTSGSEDHARAMAMALERTVKMLGRARELGVALPTDQRLTS